MQKTHLKQQIKQGKRRVFEGIVSFIFGAAVTICSVWLGANISGTKELKEIPIKVSISNYQIKKDTIYIDIHKDSITSKKLK
ncbi:MAG: hypothetical protein V4547_06290 [Bacteroidota bacterium]